MRVRTDWCVVALKNAQCFLYLSVGLDVLAGGRWRIEINRSGVVGKGIWKEEKYRMHVRERKTEHGDKLVRRTLCTVKQDFICEFNVLFFSSSVAQV